MKWKIWHIDAVGGIILAGLIADPNSNWICPGEERVIQVPVKPGANL
jgi:hypothetical protein